MSARYRVAVIQGGPSEEAEVSRVSARAVWDALRSLGHVAARLELDPFTAESIRGGGYEVVFPVVHGARGEDGCLQGLLETLDVPYVGSNVPASALAMDKALARHIFAAHGLPLARGRAVAVAPAGAALSTARELRAEFGPSIVLKPRSGGSGLSVSRFEDAAPDAAVAEALQAAWTEGRALLCEVFTRGAEATCGVLEAPDGLRALSSVEIESPSDAFYTFQARYTPGRSVHHCPGRFPAAVEAQIQATAIAAFHALGCRDLARVDFVVNADKGPAGVVLLEVNTMPGFTPTSLFPEAALHAGFDFAGLVEHLVQRAAGRIPVPAPKVAPFPQG